MWNRCAKDAYELHISLWHSNLIWIVTYSWFMTWLCGFGWALLEETITRKLQSVYLDLFFKILLFHVAYILFCRFFFSLLCLVGLLLQYVSLSQSRDLQLTMACRSSMWGKIMVPMYRLWLHGLYANTALLLMSTSFVWCRANYTTERDRGTYCN